MRKALFHITARRLILVSTLFFGLIFSFFFLQLINGKLPAVDFPNGFLFFTMPILTSVFIYFSLSLLVLPKTAKPILFGLMFICALMYFLSSDKTILQKVLYLVLIYLLPVILLMYTRINFERFFIELKKRLLRCCIAIFLASAFVPSSVEYLKILTHSDLIKTEISTLSEIFYKYVPVEPSVIVPETLPETGEL